METNAQYTEILRRLAIIDERLDGITPRKKRQALVDTRADLTQVRVRELERVFWNIVNAPRTKRKDSYRFPKALLETLGSPHRQGVVVSVLVNQAALRKAFQTRGTHDPANETAAACVRRLLERSNLVVTTLNATRLGDTSTLVALSPGEAQRVLIDPTQLPAAWKGWSCEERAKPSVDPFGGGFLPVPADPSDDARVAEAEEIEDKPPVAPIIIKKPVKRVQF